MHHTLRAAVAAASIATALIGGAATATAEPATAPTLQQIDVTTGGSSSGSVELAIQDIIKQPGWLLLPLALAPCLAASMSASISGGQGCKLGIGM
ncbi:hypothetical protein GFY24_10105 [Nocardia sp. SYP-A9097]|uniref:hypothetical protein n=1 Tax=Nocardia sp. SYP-A9097 TaxID=2663237 RepID=UPI00129BCB29|nr:hypothetical protein [Nocardia sp. SYP-A9097]MRH87798.1 hypothetical protein [Nocardia sp. SYP-A9097]